NVTTPSCRSCSPVADLATTVVATTANQRAKLGVRARHHGLTLPGSAGLMARRDVLGRPRRDKGFPFLQTTNRRLPQCTHDRSGCGGAAPLPVTMAAAAPASTFGQPQCLAFDSLTERADVVGRARQPGRRAVQPASLPGRLRGGLREAK